MNIHRASDPQKRILHRLKISRGHLEKVIRMIEDDTYCIDVLHQLQAVASGLRETGHVVLENHLKSCVADAIGKGKKDEAISEIMQVFKRGGGLLVNQKEMLYGIFGLVSEILLTILFTTSVVNSNNTGMMRVMGMRTDRMMDDDKMMSREDMMGDHDEDMSMDDMVNSLKGKTGDDFDKAFITGMIGHHQGAIDMANLARQYAGREEIKNLANDIVSAQTSEIEMMLEWQKAWGY